MTGPTARIEPSFVYDPKSKLNVLFGGTDNVATLFNDTWFYGPPDADDDGTPDCTDQCPLDPIKTAPNVCGCGFIETGSGCQSTSILSKPLRPTLSMKGKKVRVKMQSIANAQYVISYNEPKKKGSKCDSKNEGELQALNVAASEYSVCKSCETLMTQKQSI